MGKKGPFQSTETEHHLNKERFISVVIPNHNGADTIAKCLEAVFSSDYSRFEAVVVDDFSTDSSVEIIKRFPCKLLRLEGHEGVSKARNKGAGASSGELLFFTDNDCLLQKDALALANQTYNEHTGYIIGGTYTRLPYDQNFFSLFQSIFINYFETKKKVPDYIAAHAMIIDADLFRKSGGFVEDSFMGVAACVEDVEFIHRLCRAGYKSHMNPEILVRHIFNFSFLKSLNNAVKKSRYWTLYSILNKDLWADSGTASAELKINVGIFLINTCLFLLYWLTGTAWVITIIPFLFLFNLYVNQGLFDAFFKTKGLTFLILAVCYYTMVYPLAVGGGALLGAIQYLWGFKVLRKYES